jgi:large subunit ribosomal protein L24
MMRIKKNDTVQVVSGKDQGKRGLVIKVVPGNDEVVVQGVAVVTHYVKAQRAGVASGLQKREAAVAASKVMPVCSACDAPSRVRFSMLEGDRKVRVCARCEKAF